MSDSNVSETTRPIREVSTILTEDQIASPEKPHANEELAVELAMKYWGIYATFARELDSYGDRNFYIKGSKKDSNGATENNEFVLKILNSDDSANPNIIRAQNQCMLFLKERGISCSFPLLANTGKHTVFVKDDDFQEKGNAVRMMNFLPGKMLKDAFKVKASSTPVLLYNSGRFVAQLDKELKDFKDPNLISYEFSCDLQYLSQLEPFIQPNHIKNEADLDLIVKVFKQYKRTVPPVLQRLTKQVIHNDANDRNILMNNINNHHHHHHHFSIIDFGDTCYSYRVFEVAIAMSDIIALRSEGSTFDNAGYFLRGYQSVFPLSEDELSIIYWCIAGRFVQLLIHGSVKLSMQPCNDYVRAILQPMWDALPRFASIDHCELLDMWIKGSLP